MQNRNKTQGILSLLLAYSLWGFFPIYWKLLRALPPDRIIAHRIAWSFVFAIALIFLTGKWTQLAALLKRPRDLLIFGLAALMITINWFVFIYAVNSGQIVESSLGYYINPLFSIAMGAVLFKERFKGGQIAAIALAAAGVAVMTVQVGRLPWISLVLAASFGTYGLLKKMVQTDSAVGLAVETAMLSPFALAYLLAAPKTGFFPINPEAAAGALAAGSPWLWVLLPLGGAVTAVPLILFATGARNLDLSMVGFLQYLAPTLMLLLGVLAYGEPFTTAHAICFGLIWAGLFLYTASKMELWQLLARKKNQP
ncbi:MAG TPA: EamA family transporter RarD [Clostridiales bacterium]|nr:EamA family transporter RarD [Clostridiales bacterium]